MSRYISEHRKKLLDDLTVAGRENSQAAVMFHSAVAARMGLGPSEEKTLDLLQRRGPLSAGEIVQHTGLAPASVTGLIDRLEAKWYVRRVRDARDRRRVMVEINPEMLHGGEDLFATLVNGLAELYEGYTDEQLELILDFLNRVTAIQTAATAEIS
ncbi:MarR family winged helix-turn-helix transcriptional regulator [Nonomuraea sp. NPDC050328]|uniref:MarR family winged helix-turn-helix transcriptional regulator n=1 Tax=Nonomuraea sp. NPDC050328 TaxID=3364361 RepID=UPI0037A1612B